MKRTNSLTVVGLLAVCLTTSAAADTVKTLHIQLPPDASNADDMHVTFFGPVNQAPKGTKPDRTDEPSDHFDGASGVGTNTLNFSAPTGSGAVTPGTTDNFHVGIKGDPAGEPTASNIVTKVEFTRGDMVFRTLAPGTPAQTKEFKKFVTGFTNDEAFDFSNSLNAMLLLFNTDAALNLRYRFSDFSVYKDLPLTKFNVSQFQDTISGTLVFSTPELVINPGSMANISLGAVAASTYALAKVGTITIEDLTDGSVQTYSVPQGFGETTPTIPEPSEIILLAIGLLGISGYCLWKHNAAVGD